MTPLSSTPPSTGTGTFGGVPVAECAVNVPPMAVEDYKAADGWKEFTNITGIDDNNSNFYIVDGEEYERGEAQEDAHIIYTRTFTSTRWQPLYVPFSMNAEDWNGKATVAELVGVHLYDDGRTVIEFLTVKDGSTVANAPYLIKPAQAGEMTIELDGRTLEAAPQEGTRYIASSSPRWTFKFYGNHKAITGSEIYSRAGDNGAYTMSDRGTFAMPGEDDILQPGRFYLTMEKSCNGYWETRAVHGDEILLMVDGVIVGNATGMLGIAEQARKGTWHDLSGRKVPASQSGIYITNGKKIAVK